jgi:hypothetical protein
MDKKQFFFTVQAGTSRKEIPAFGAFLWRSSGL